MTTLRIMFEKRFILIILLFLIPLSFFILTEGISGDESGEDFNFSKQNDSLPINIGGTDSLSEINCFDYYHLNSVEIDLNIENGTAVANQPLTVNVILRNHNDYPLVDGSLWIQIFRENENNLSERGNYLIDEFSAVENISLNGLSEKGIGFSWDPPVGLSGGSFMMVGHFLVGGRMNLSGLSFNEDIYGGLTRFWFEENIVNEVYFEKEGVKINGQDYLARMFLPRIESDSVEISFALKNLGNQLRDVNLKENLYIWDNVGSSRSILSSESDLLVTAGGRESLLKKFDNLKPGVYLFEAKTDQSILKVRFVIEGESSPRFNYLALTDFPIKANQENSFFACFHGDNYFNESNGRVEVVLEDETGNQIARWDYDGSIRSSIMGGREEFITRQNYNQVWLRGKIYKETELVDQIDLFYDVNSFTDPIDLDVQIENSQLIVQPKDMAERRVSARLLVEVADSNDQLIYLNPNYYGDSLEKDIDFEKGEKYQIKVLMNGIWYKTDYSNQADWTIWPWLFSLIFLLSLGFFIFWKKRKSNNLSGINILCVFIVLISVIWPLSRQINASGIFVNRAIANSNNGMSHLLCSREPAFKVSPIKTGSIATIIGSENEVKMNASYNYPIYFVDIATGERKSNQDILGVGDILRIEFDDPEGGWYIAGGWTDVLPITWADDAYQRYDDFKSSGEGTLQHKTAHIMRGDTQAIEDYIKVFSDEKYLYDSFNGSLGVMATDLIESGQVEIKVTDGFRYFREGGHRYVEAVAPGTGTIEVSTPDSFMFGITRSRFSSLPQYDIETESSYLGVSPGSLPGINKVVTVGIVPQKEIISASLSVNRRSAEAPISIDLVASASPDNTIEKLNDYTFWCNCHYSGTNIENALSQCGPYDLRVIDQEGYYRAENICQYNLAGNYIPKVIIERGWAEPTQAQVFDLDVSAIPEPQSLIGSLVMNPNRCTNDCRSCLYPLEPNLYWHFKSNDGVDQNAFEIHFADNQAFNNYINVSDGWLLSSDESYKVPEYLDYGQEYYWRIRVRDGRGVVSDWMVYDGSYITPSHAYPTPDFTWDPILPILGEETQFINQSQVYNEGEAHYIWTFPEAKILDGSSQGLLTLNDQNPLIVFDGENLSRLVKIVVTDDAGLYCDLSHPITIIDSSGLIEE